MQLHEKIRYVSEVKKISLAKMAKSIEVPPANFHKWLNATGQKNIWEHLPKILEMVPDLRREWLYFDDGPAFADGTAPPQDKQDPLIAALQAQVAELEASNQELVEELRETNRVNRQLAAKLLEAGRQPVNKDATALAG